MSGQTPAPAQDFDDEKLRKSIVASHGTEQGSKPAVNAPGRPKLRPDTHFAQYENVDPEKMERMKAGYDQDVASGTRAPGARFLEGARNTRSGSGTAMAVNDAAESVHDIAASGVGRAVGAAVGGGIGGDPAKFVASVSTVAQAGSQAIDQFDSGRNAVYAQSKQVYEKSSDNRQSAMDSLHALNMKASDQLTDEQRANESKVLRNVWKTTGRNIAKGLKTAALATTTGNKGELLSENLMKHTSGGQTDLAPGEVAQKEHVAEGSMYGKMKRRYNDGDSKKLSADRKATDEQLGEHQKSLEDRRDYELKLRAPFMGMSVQVHDPSNTDDETNQFFMDEHDAKKVHTKGIKDLGVTAAAELEKREKKPTSWGKTTSHQALLADEQEQHDAAKAGYDSATSEAIALREAHRKKNSDTFDELHNVTPGKLHKGAKQFANFVTGGRVETAKTLTVQEKEKKEHAKAEKTKLGTPHTLENLKPYMTEEQLALASNHDRTMKNLESVRDTGLNLDQHDEVAEHKAGLEEIGVRKTTGLSKGDREELAETQKRRADLRDSQREHDQTIGDHLGETADAQGRFGGAYQNEDEVTSPTILGRIAQGAVSTAGGLRTGAGILSGKDSYARPALAHGDLGTAAATGVMGATHQVVGAVSTALGAPINSETLVKPVVGLTNASADVIQGLAGAKADEEERKKVKRELKDGTRRENTRSKPVNFMGSTDYKQAPTDHLGMLQAGLTGVDDHLRELSPTYDSGRTKIDDSVASAKEAAKHSLAEQVNSPAEDVKESAEPSVPVHEDVKDSAEPSVEDVKDSAEPSGAVHEDEKASAEPDVPVHEDVKDSAEPSGAVHEDEKESAESDVPAHEDESATAEPENVTGQDEIPAQEAEAPAEKEEEEEWWADKKEKPEADGPTVPAPVVEPDPVHKPKLDLAQVRAAGRKSTAAQAGKHHDPTSQVSDQTKQEYTSPELNQYSWKTMKTSGQRIRRGAQNAWKRTKNFGKRMSGRLSRFFGR